MGALLTADAASCFAPDDQGGTYNGSPLMCAVGLAVLETLLHPGFLETVQARGRYLVQGLLVVASRHNLGKIRGSGLLLALDTLQADATTIAARAFDHDLLLNAPRINTSRFVPALTVSERKIDEMLSLLDRVLGYLKKHIEPE